MARNGWRNAGLLLVAIGLFFCLGLGARPYLTPSEARYIEIPRQMLATGDWLTPRINGVPYFEKPPFFYWMQATFMAIGGTGEFAGRLVTALLANLTCLLAYATGRMLYGRRAGLLAALVLATSLLGYGLSRVAMLDMPVSFFITAALTCFLAAQRAEGARKRDYYWLMYAAAALAVLSKGLIGMVIPGLVIGSWIAFSKRWDILKEARLLSGTLLFLAIAAPWHVLMSRTHPAFADFYFIHEHFTRFTSDEHHRTAPWWFFIAVTPAGLLPWTGLLAAVKRKPQGDNLFLLLWIALPLLFYSSSHSKLVPYIFPIFPSLAVLIGATLADYWPMQEAPRALRLNALLVILLFGSAIALHAFLPEHGKFELLSGLTMLMLLPLIAALVGLTWTLVAKHSVKNLIIALAGFGAVVGLTVNYAAGALDDASVKPLAAKLATQLKPGDYVAAYGSYFQDLPVYLNRNVTVAGWEGELSFGIEHYPYTQSWMIGETRFWQDCAQANVPFYVFMKQSIYAQLPPHESCPLREIGEYGKTVLLQKDN